MLDIGWSELLIIGVVALVVVGPKDLPKLLRLVGQWIGKMRRMASEFQGQVNEAIREAELEDVKKTVDDLKSYNPANMIKSELDSALEPIKQVKDDLDAEMTRLQAGLDPERPNGPDVEAVPAAAPPSPPVPEPTAETLGLPEIEPAALPVIPAASVGPEPVPAEPVRPAEPKSA